MELNKYVKIIRDLFRDDEWPGQGEKSLNDYYVAIANRVLFYRDDIARALYIASLLDDNDINRVEVIDEDGRSYVNMRCKDVKISLQDNESTLKIFLENDKYIPPSREELEKVLNSHTRDNQKNGLYDD